MTHTSAKEWSLAVAGTALAGYQVFLLKQMDIAQSGLNYYAEQPGVRILHLAMTAIDGLVLGVVTAWIVVPKYGRAWRTGTVGLAALGAVLGWVQLAGLARPARGAVFRFAPSPFYPASNLGIVGVQVFLGYIVWSVLSRERSAGRAAPLLWSAATFALQWIVWDVVSRQL